MLGSRIPAIETTPDGTLLALAEARKYNLDDPGFEKQDIDLVFGYEFITFTRFNREWLESAAGDKAGSFPK